MHPLLHLIVKQPHLLAEHAEAYAELAKAEIGAVSASFKRQALFGAAALFCVGVSVVLGGVALMLWAVTPSGQIHAVWALFAVPLVPLAGAVLCALAARGHTAAPAFSTIREQVKADMAMLREAGSL